MITGLVLLMLPLMANAAIAESGECGEGITWALDTEGTLTISGSGEMTSHPWTDNNTVRNRIKKVIVSDGITEIIDRAFYNCQNLASITKIAANACKGLKKLTALTVGKNVSKIGKNAFSSCKKLKSITVKTSSLTKNSIGKACFQNIEKKAVFKVPKKMLKDYQEWFVKVGKAPKTATFKK